MAKALLATKRTQRCDPFGDCPARGNAKLAHLQAGFAIPLEACGNNPETFQAFGTNLGNSRVGYLQLESDL
jgi:hypothetical protein